MKAAATSLLRTFSAVLLTGALSLSALAETGEEFPDNTLAGIYELAVQDDLSLEQARAQYRVGREERKLALAGLLPSLQAGYTISETDSESRGSFPVGGTSFPNATDRESDSNAWEVSLRQPIFDLPAWFRFKQGEELSNQAQATLSVAQQDLVLRTVNAYFAVLRASANLKASRAQQDALKGQLDQVKQRFDVGLVAITDVHEAEA
ncbi:MAG: TolC family protein, partial [Pseudomonadales bacterium]|nr:TolC family protein [Pseudomonadales bacterium]